MKLIQLSIPYQYAPSTYPIGGSYQILNTLNALICRKEVHKGFNKHLLMLGEDTFESVWDMITWRIFGKFMILGPRSNCVRSRSKIKDHHIDLDLKKDQDQLNDL